MLAFLLATLACSLALAAYSLTGKPVQAQLAAPPLQFLGAWGVRGNQPGQLDEPVSLTTDAVGNIYIADAGSQFVHKFSPTGTPLFSFQEGGLKHPDWVALDRGGAIYVADPVRNSVFICMPDLEHYHELHLRTRPAKENLVSVAVGWDGLIHILDSNAAKVFTYNPRMHLLESWQPRGDTPGARNEPGPIQMGPDGSLYVANGSGSRILKFSREGSLIAEIGATPEDPSGTRRRLSSEFAVGANYLYVMDVDGRMLHVWTLDGQPKLDVDLAPELGQAPRSAPPLAVSSRGELIVLDTPLRRVLRYHINF
jgi:hypothetical protein